MHYATDSGNCYKFRHLLKVQALAAIDSGNLIQSNAIYYWVTQSAADLPDWHALFFSQQLTIVWLRRFKTTILIKDLDSEQCQNFEIAQIALEKGTQIIMRKKKRKDQQVVQGNIQQKTVLYRL